MDKARRKELLRQHKASEHTTARRTLGLTNVQLTSLLTRLDEANAEQHCDRTLRMTRDWAQAQGLDASAITASLGELAAFCDCEVLANVTPDRFGWPEH
jgi:hypothetical protein